MRASAAGAAALVAALLAGCTPDARPTPQPTVAPSVSTAPQPSPSAAKGVQVEKGIAYSAPDGTELLLDAYLPGDVPAGSGVPAVVVVHGGGFTGGARDALDAAPVAAVLAEAGIAAFPVDYRLLPAPFPAALTDVQAAVRWLREPEQVERFAIDAGRIGLFGGSAGAILAAEAGTAGSGPQDADARVRAVVALSGLYDSDPALAASAGPERDTALAYLGCADLSDCAAADDASPLAAVDPTDPPFLVAHSADERLPVGSAERFAAALQAAGIPAILEIRPGDAHSIALLDVALARRILAFYQEFL
ncbi:MAG TPA: alpha/beta hydrolase [Naasia sp.]|jgi:acetyl esterase/lipase